MPNLGENITPNVAPDNVTLLIETVRYIQTRPHIGAAPVAAIAVAQFWTGNGPI